MIWITMQNVIVSILLSEKTAGTAFFMSLPIRRKDMKASAASVTRQGEIPAYRIKQKDISA